MRSRFRDYRGVGQPVGAVVMGLSVAIALCALLGWLFNLLDPPQNSAQFGGEQSLLFAAASTFAVGVGLFFFGRRHASEVVTRREAGLAVVLIWLAAGAFGAIPFVFGAGMTPADAFFEAVSGLTTTGATVITNIEGLSRPLLLWRSLIQWLGGMGIVVLFVAVFPNIGAGGKHMFGDEVPGTTAEGLKPRIAETSRVLWKFYLVFTIVVTGALYLLDMSLFDAVCHALTTMSTGGFSTRDASVGGFDSAPIELTLSLFMIIASVNYGLFYASLRGRSVRAFLRSVEFRAFVIIVVGATAILTFGIFEVHGKDVFQSFRYSVFMVATTVSSTGFGTDNYTAYPPLMLGVVILMMFIGGCAGSTAGGIKIERVLLMGKVVWTEIRRSIRPNLVHVVRMGATVVAPSALSNATVFFIIYMGCMGAGTALITAIEGVPLETSFGAILTCLSNMGPAPFHIEADNFARYSAAAKGVFSFAMLLGRLEFFALLSLLVPGFWRR